MCYHFISFSRHLLNDEMFNVCRYFSVISIVFDCSFKNHLIQLKDPTNTSSMELVYQPSEQFDLLQGLGFGPKLAEAIDKLCQGGYLPSELSDQVIDALRDIAEQQALHILTTFQNSNLSTVNNRNVFLLGLIKQSVKGKMEPIAFNEDGSVVVGASGPAAPLSSRVGVGAATGTGGSATCAAVPQLSVEKEMAFDVHDDVMDYEAGYMSAATAPNAQGMYGGGVGLHPGMYGGGGGYGGPVRQRSSKTGPDPEALAQILARTGYPHETSPSLRRYGGPPPDWTGPKPTQGVEVFLGKLPEDLFEDELIPLMEKCGKIYELRVIVDKEGYNRGFGFVTFCDKQSARNAVNTYNNYRIRNRRMVANLNVQFTKLYVGGIPKDKTREQIFSAFSQEVERLTDVVIQDASDDDNSLAAAPTPNSSSSSHNRGYCFLEFDSYFDAAAARRKLMNSRHSIRAWDHYRKFKVDWAIPLENPDEAVANSSTVILVTHLNPSISTNDLTEKFGKYGTIKSCNKSGQHHAFVTFAERSAAETAAEAENHQFIKDAQVEVQIHVPLTQVAKRMVEAIKGPRGGGGHAMGGGGRGRGYGGQGHHSLYDVNNPAMAAVGFRRGAGGGHYRGGVARGGRGGGGGYPFNPIDRAGTFTRARMLGRPGGGFFNERGGGGGGGNPYGMQRGQGVTKNKFRGGGGGPGNQGGAGGTGAAGGFSMQHTYSQLGSSFTQF